MPLQGTVIAVGRDSTLGQLQSLIESASLHRPSGLFLSDRTAQWFLAVILLLAALTGLHWAFNDADRMMPAVMAVLIVTCPCALSLAAPSAWLAATVSLARRGIWVRRVESLETLATANRVLLDKTGTLTAGLTLLPPIKLGPRADTHSLQVARALAHQSSHPLSRAIDVGLAGLDVALLSLPAGRETAGQGLVLELEGVRWELGRPSQAGQCVNQVELRRDGEPVWGFEIDTPVDPNAGRALAWLRRQGLRLGLLSGDRAERARALWQALGGTPDEVQADLDPSGKLSRLETLQAQGEVVVMVGDGINDAPVMSKADVSVAVGRAVPLARAQADVVLAHDGVQRLPELLATAWRTRRVIRLNLLWAGAYNLLSVPLAAAGLINPWMAGLGMALSSLLVLGHSLRLLRPITLE
jgi:Cu2+-exporting ATPase